MMEPSGGGYFAALRAKARASSRESLFASFKRFRPKNPKTGIMPLYDICYIRGVPILPILEEKGTIFSDQTGPTKRNRILTIFSYFVFLFRIPYISEEKQGSEPVFQKRNGKFQSYRSEETKMDLSI